MSDALNEIERVFLALSDKTRIRLVDTMRDGEVSVNYLCESLGESQPKVSRHLAYLRSMGMVNTRRDGKWVYYRLAEPEHRYGSRLLHDTLDWIGHLTRGTEDSVLPKFDRSVPAEYPALSSMEDDISDQANVNRGHEDMEVYLL